eukprot:TRINITY_DN6032_c0_g4_i4.p1 TRINITY_DN6032_c0_g4~~TRINITY_DN6032_c0_g4_i4.p1  ORF type:complete len:413 (+),score=39.78 TRINITY_DN6032_c0_g4_i4:178-1239(+)
MCNFEYQQVAKTKRTISRAACLAQNVSNNDTQQIKKVMYDKDMECSVTLIGRVVSKPELVKQTGKFVLGLLTPEEKHNYCQIETSGVLSVQTQASISLGNVVAVKGVLQSFSGPRFTVSASKLVLVVDPPIAIANIPPPPLSKDQFAQDEVPEDVEGKWQHLLQNPSDWWDMREDNEEGSNRPAFRHKRAKNRALWINDYTPQSYLQAIQNGECNLKKFPGWRMLLQSPDDFWDNRYNRKTEKHPHFIHKASGSALWYNYYTATPEYQKFYGDLKNTEYKGSRPTDPWEDLLQHPGNWVDKRRSKTNDNAPDFTNIQFVKLGQHYGLWLEGCPKEIQAKLTELDETGKLTFAQ